MNSTARKPLLEVKNLSVRFQTEHGVGTAVDQISFSLETGDSLGVVGESGCGKSVTAMTILGLIEAPPGKVESGRIVFKDRDLLKLTPDAMRRIRGREISMIFQEPLTSLNPVLTIGRQVAEPLVTHQNMAWSEAYAAALEWLDRVKIPDARKRMKDYPHQLSGGMHQRVMIAMALICNPDLLIADEPTTALDVSIQSQILSLVSKLREDLNMSLLLITHDMGVIAQMVRRVAVMYAGQVMELAGVRDIFDSPFHPYTKGLLKSIPKLGGRAKESRRRLPEIRGMVPSFLTKTPGCKFSDRCPDVFELCKKQQPDLKQINEKRFARCWLDR
jgi:oligopeptide/dipeptide ABC transporter ATP-binding protein